MVLLFLKFDGTEKFLVTANYAFTMLVVAVVDWEHLMIPNRVVVTGIFLGTLLGLCFQPATLPDVWTAAFLTTSVALLLRSLGNRLLRRESMGMGDIKLAAVVGLFLGVKLFLLSLWLAAILGVVVGMVRRREHKITRHIEPRVRGHLYSSDTTEEASEIPFGSMLAASSVIVLIFQELFTDIVSQWMNLIQ